MDSDFYIEETHTFKIIVICLLIVGATGALIWAYFHYYQNENVKLKEVYVELGTKLPTDNNTYLEGKSIDEYSIDTSNIMVDEEGLTASVGDYSYKVSKSDFIKKGKLFVRDTTAPEVKLQDITVGVNEKFSANEFISECIDLSNECNASFKDDISKIVDSTGDYEINLIIKDASGNKTEKTANLTVSDTTSLLEIKETDFNAVKVSNKDTGWNNTFTIKFEKGLDEHSEEFENKILEISAQDFTSYIPNEKLLKSQEMLYIYNKYNYAIGVSIKLIFSDDTLLYITN